MEEKKAGSPKMPKSTGQQKPGTPQKPAAQPKPAGQPPKANPAGQVDQKPCY